MPRLGESINEGTVGRWLKQPGDSVALMEPLLEISTEKIDTEIPSPAAGTLLEVRVAEGETVAVGTVLAVIGTPVFSDSVFSDSAQLDTESLNTEYSTEPQDHQGTKTPYYSPVVQKIAAEEGVDLTRVAGTGMGGRVTRRDVEAFVREGVPEAVDIVEADSDMTLIPLTAMRRAIAQHMTQSVRTAPHVATVFEVDMSAVVQHRESVRVEYAERGVRLTYSAYFLHAVANALVLHPLANGRFTVAGIVLNRSVHLGVAVSIGKDDANGLVTPVIRDADKLSLEGCARALQDVTERARTNRLMPEELEGGTFTLTNHGTGGSIIGTPIIVQPQAAILGVGAIQKRAVIRASGASLLPSADDAIVIRPMCYLTLSFDHRILDGASADAFLRDVQYLLEAWGEGNQMKRDSQNG